MSGRIELIVGLGNPGPEYVQTRHNAGFWFLDRLAHQLDLNFRLQPLCQGQVARLTLGECTCWLLKPLTFMNRSGQSIAAMAGYYRIPCEHILVVHDDLDLPPGTVRLKQGGGHGGHNGLRDLIVHLGDSSFSRLRLGIGHPGSRDLVMPYVLSCPPLPDRLAIESAIETAIELLPHILQGEFEKVMNRLHRREKN